MATQEEHTDLRTPIFISERNISKELVRDSAGEGEVKNIRLKTAYRTDAIIHGGLVCRPERPSSFTFAFDLTYI